MTQITDHILFYPLATMKVSLLSLRNLVNARNIKIGFEVRSNSTLIAQSVLPREMFS